MTLPHVNKAQQRDDGTVEIQVETSSFRPGQEVEVSGYFIQGSNAYAAFTVKKHIPLDANPSALLHVQLPKMDLTSGDDVTVVTRIAEVWSTILQQDKSAEFVGQGLQAAWSYQDQYEDPSGKGPGDAESQSTGDGKTEVTTAALK